MRRRTKHVDDDEIIVGAPVNVDVDEESDDEIDTSTESSTPPSTVMDMDLFVEITQMVHNAVAPISEAVEKLEQRQDATEKMVENLKPYVVF